MAEYFWKSVLIHFDRTEIVLDEITPLELQELSLKYMVKVMEILVVLNWWNFLSHLMAPGRKILKRLNFPFPDTLQLLHIDSANFAEKSLANQLAFNCLWIVSLEPFQERDTLNF